MKKKKKKTPTFEPKPFEASYVRILLSSSPSGKERCDFSCEQGAFRLKAGPNLEIPPEAFVGKSVGIRGIMLEPSPDPDDWDAYHFRHETGLVEVHEWTGCEQYPKEQLLKDAERIKSPPVWSQKYVTTDSLGIFCSQCKGTLGLNINPNQAEYFKDRLCDTCEALPPSTRTGLTFTQKELEAAYQQMEYERKLDGEKAKRMFEWVCAQAEIDVKCGSPVMGESYGNVISPYPTPYYFQFTHQTYGPYLNYFTDALKKQSWARHVRGTGNGPIYEVDTPEGTYEVRFDYFDNHSCGW
jgi:hypothetical protein